MKIFQYFAQWIFPSKCVLCRKKLDRNELDLCQRCRTEVPGFVSRGKQLQFLDSWTAVWYYDGCVRSSLLRYKFQNARSYANAYGRMLAMKLMQQYPEGFDLITWVPISPMRKFRRGYDQVELLARAVCRELGTKPVRLLRKVRHNPPQSGLNEYAARRANVLGVYRAVNTEIIRGKRILLLDDIITTGATIGECARVLLTAGAGQVHGASIAARKEHHKQSNK